MMIPYPPRKALIKAIKTTKAPAFLVTNLVNIRWLTGIYVSAGVILLSTKGNTFFVDDRYLELAREKVPKHFRIFPARDLKAHVKKEKRIAIEADTVTVAELARLKRSYLKTTFISSQGVIEELRREKSVEEITLTLRACAITKKILARIPRYLRPGISELQLAQKIEEQSRTLGAEELAFETIVGFAEHTARPHHRPTKRRLKKGDVVQIDMGVKVGGYCSDYSRVYFTGTVLPEQRRVLSALKKAQKTARSLVRSGVTNRALDLAARKVLKAAGLEKEFCHALGHGVGLEIHEGTVLSKKASLKKLKRNEVITLEPGVYFPGKWGMRWEDTVIVR